MVIVLFVFKFVYGECMYLLYIYIDVFLGFFFVVKECFKEYEGFQYVVLDIFKDFLEQGFDFESFDFIIVCNVSDRLQLQ